MPRYPIESSLLATATYWEEGNLLELEFRDGALYRFFDVTAECFQQLMAADSKGTFFNRNIRNRFRFQRFSQTGEEN